MGEATEREAICGLVVETCALAERAARTATADDRLVREAVLLRDELVARLPGTADAALAADAAAGVAELDTVLLVLDRLPARVPALTG